MDGMTRRLEAVFSDADRIDRKAGEFTVRLRRYDEGIYRLTALTGVRGLVLHLQVLAGAVSIGTSRMGPGPSRRGALAQTLDLDNGEAGAPGAELPWTTLSAAEQHLFRHLLAAVGFVPNAFGDRPRSAFPEALAFAEASLGALRETLASKSNFSASALLTLVKGGPDAVRLADLVRRYPPLAPLVSAAPGLVELCVGPGCEAVLSHLEGKPWRLSLPLASATALPVAEIMRALPRDWWPEDQEEYTAFAVCADIVWRIAQQRLDRVPGLLAHAKGRWAECLDRLCRKARDEPFRPASLQALRNAADDVSDPVDALSRELLQPAALAAGGEDVLMAMRGNVRHPAFTALAWSLLAEGRGAAAVLELSRRWHAGRAGDIPEDDAATWPALFEPWTAPNGLVVRCLASAPALREEGLAMRHCVGGYVDACLDGEAHIASIAKAAPDGSLERLSTVEMRLGIPGLRVAQHRAVANDAPRPEAQAALDAFLEAVHRREVALAEVERDSSQRGQALNEARRRTAEGRLERIHGRWRRFLRPPDDGDWTRIRDGGTLAQALASARESFGIESGPGAPGL